MNVTALNFIIQNGGRYGNRTRQRNGSTNELTALHDYNLYNVYTKSSGLK